MLETAAPFLKSKKLRVRLAKYLVLLQRYVLTKSYLPMLLEFMLLDILDSLAPRLTRFKSLEEVDTLLKAVRHEEIHNHGKNSLEILYRKPESLPKETKRPQDFQSQLEGMMGAPASKGS